MTIAIKSSDGPTLIFETVIIFSETLLGTNCFYHANFNHHVDSK
jgi:hypothetical protein